MSSKIAIALLTSVAVAATSISTDALAFGHGGGGGFHGGGGGFHGGGFGGFHGGFGGFHGGFAGFHGFGGVHAGGFHGFTGQGVVSHGFSGAHNQFAAGNFHSLYNFNGAGFNRNVFGNGHEWDHWGGRFWGAGWNNWGWGWGGWAGPVFWPFLYGDVFSFLLWPYDYYDPFWAFGSDFVLSSIYAPGPYFGPAYGYEPGSDVYYGSNGGATQFSKADREALAQTDAAAAQSCGGLAPGVSGLPIDQIRKTVRPAADQAAALDDLSTASTKANDIVKASCPSEIPLTPIARLDAAEKRLDAMIEAAQIVRSPLEKFYDSLSDQQKQQFEAMGKSGNVGAQRGSTATGNLAALCGQQAGNVAKLPVQRIEQVVKPDAQQQSAFDDLKQASENGAKRLQASCPTAMPQTPVARLDAVATRLGAMVEAMNTIRPKLKEFYDSLSDEQKAKFNIMGPPENPAAPQLHSGNQ